jgi:hypothetical protein
MHPHRQHDFMLSSINLMNIRWLIDINYTKSGCVMCFTKKRKLEWIYDVTIVGFC